MTWISLPDMYERDDPFARVPTGYDTLDKLLEGGLRPSAVTLITNQHLAHRIAIHQAAYQPGSVSIITLGEWDTPEGLAAELFSHCAPPGLEYFDVPGLFRSRIDDCRFKAIRVESHEDAHLAIKETTWQPSRPRLVLVQDPASEESNIEMRAAASLELDMAATSTTSVILWIRQGPTDPTSDEAHDFIYGSPLGRIAHTIILADHFDPSTGFVSPYKNAPFEEVRFHGRDHKDDKDVVEDYFLDNDGD